MAKQSNTKVITGLVRLSYANVWEPKSINGGTPKYSVSIIIPKSDARTIAKVKAAIEAAYREGEAKLKGNGKTVPPFVSIKTPLRDGDIERPDDEALYRAGQRVGRQILRAQVSIHGGFHVLAQAPQKLADQNRRDHAQIVPPGDFGKMQRRLHSLAVLP